MSEAVTFYRETPFDPWREQRPGEVLGEAEDFLTYELEPFVRLSDVLGVVRCWDTGTVCKRDRDCVANKLRREFQ